MTTTAPAPASGIPDTDLDGLDGLDGLAFRASPSLAKVAHNLGLLAELPGHWVGHGFNLIARPDQQTVFFLEMNPTKETLDFTTIGGAIPNRGSEQADINLRGLHYLQQISDARTDTGLHIEPGLWIHVPRTHEPKAPATYVRQATIPHGDSLLAQSVTTSTTDGKPDIPTVDAFPFTGKIPPLDGVATQPETSKVYLHPYLHKQLPRHVTPERADATVVKNPALVLEDAIAGQNITKTVTIQIATDPVGGILNIPFVVNNANAARLDAIFWIETVQDPKAGEIMQLQYLQRVILDFSGIRWPHISVATLRKQ